MAPAAKIKHALNGAACFPGRVAISGGYAIGYNNFSPTTRKILLIILRVQTIWCKDLLAMAPGQIITPPPPLNIDSYAPKSFPPIIKHPPLK
ncbi:hypothetical protein BDQ12DRAFT_657429 [Crucibulum laeve]|uniref:Uncharacterized protein n=1 Tax=Crucibulum laeve TaxID=68775 RepID=A0A5C3LL87_9AGAR|nr:hypothetical protein BDQ12DRAFT_657429 [Crucibulum laeve]